MPAPYKKRHTFTFSKLNISENLSPFFSGRTGEKKENATRVEKTVTKIFQERRKILPEPKTIYEA